MNTNLINILSIAGISIGMFLIGMSLTNPQQEVQATGGPGVIKELIDPMIDRAIEYLQNNNTELALEEIQTIKNELADTFEADEEED